MRVAYCATQKMKQLLPSVDAAILRNSPTARLAAHLCTSHDVPWAMEVVGDVWDALWNYGSVVAKAYAPVAEWHSRYVIRRAPFALYVTQRTLQEKYPCEGHTVGASNVVIPAPEEEVLQRRIERERSRASASRLTLGFVGTIENKTKGLEPAFRALERAAPKLPDLEFRILGPGDPEPWKQKARKMGIENQVFFDGAVPGGKPVLEWLDEIDVYVHPSLQDGLPRSLIEAMSRGCPALASRAGGIPELLPSSVTHVPGDWKRLAKHIRKFVPCADWRMQHARQNFETAKDYSQKKLKERRSEFWGKFAEYAQQQKTP
ncbi:glycosyltransferase [Salinibacter ruber]|uniref:glycosyltransferase n=1 Tax=Salinibacter ruber TaxID=146919 RepID=UPI00184A5D3F|nr:glycosyltransferase involved in cell wall biosynthesis [Salinibacter ruber]